MVKGLAEAEDDLGLAVIDFQGNHFETGVPVTFEFLRNTEPAPRPGPQDQFQQRIEPAGRFMIVNEQATPENLVDGWELGEITFENPLVLEFNTTGEPYYDETSWKARLAERYGKTGMALTKALFADGYDGIVTVHVMREAGREEPFHTKEIVSLKVNPRSVNEAENRIGYHGTFWRAPEDVTNSERDAEYFCTWNAPDPEDTLVVLRGNALYSNPFVWQGEDEIELPGGEYFELNLDDRRSAFDFIRGQGHDAFIVPRNYPYGGDDVALLRDGLFDVTEAKLKFPGQDWTDWLPLSDAIEMFAREQFA
jgi:hypothetical protein